MDCCLKSIELFVVFVLHWGSPSILTQTPKCQRQCLSYILSPPSSPSHEEHSWVSSVSVVHLPPLSLWRVIHGMAMLQEPHVSLTTPNMVVCSPAAWKSYSALPSQNTPSELLFQVWWWGGTDLCLLCYLKSLRKGMNHACGPGSFWWVPLNLCQFLQDITVSEFGGEAVQIHIPSIIYTYDE